jgi:N-acetylmuramoyl-L-alanine amidase
MRVLWFLSVLVVMAGCSRPTSSVYYAPADQEIAYTPPKPYTPPPPVKPLYPDVLIDPGHGGKDRGTHADGKVTYEEKSLTLMTSRVVARYLTEMGYRVSLTRREDKFVDLKERVRIAERQHPKLFVSIHYNSAPSVKAHGIEIFYYQGEKEDTRSRASKSFAEDVLDVLLTATKAKSRGVKNGNLHVLRENSFPAILIEGGFLTNSDERKLIYTKAYQEKIAMGIAKGIDKYLKEVN